MPASTKNSESSGQSPHITNTRFSFWHVHLQGDWSRHERYRILNIFQRLREQSGGIPIPQLFNHQGTVLHHSGRPGRVGRTRGADIFLDEDWTDWTLAHELGHRWNNAWGRQPEMHLQKMMRAGKLEWLKKGMRQLAKWFEKFLRRLGVKARLDWRTLWYHPGNAPPPCGVDRNFNASEDLAECFAATIFQEDAKKRAMRASERLKEINKSWNWPTQYPNFSVTPRGQTFRTLITILYSKEKSPQQTNDTATKD